MSNVDYGARVDSMKGLTIIFIIIISVASLCLLIKIVSQRTAVYTVQRLMVTFLSLGTLLFALFSLVYSARTLFEPYSSTLTNCRYRVTANVYGGYYLPFVYAVGIIVLAVELYFGRSKSTHPRPVIRFVYISIPWLLGLILVLPLTMAGIDWDTCRGEMTLSRLRAIVVVCLLIPAVCAIITAGVLRMTVTSNSQATTNTAQGTPALAPSAPVYNEASYNTVATGGVILAPAHHQQEHPVMKAGQYQPNDHQALPPQYHTIVQNPPHLYQHYNQGPPMYNPPPTGYAPPPNYAPPPPGFGTPYYTVTNPVPSTVVTPAPTNNTRDLRKETGAILAASIIFFVCTFPYCVYLLGYVYNEDRERLSELGVAVLNDTIYWITVLRWFLLCISWFKLA